MLFLFTKRIIENYRFVLHEYEYNYYKIKLNERFCHSLAVDGQQDEPGATGFCEASPVCTAGAQLQADRARVDF